MLLLKISVFLVKDIDTISELVHCVVVFINRSAVIVTTIKTNLFQEIVMVVLFLRVIDKQELT